jgi:hypothetical protein
MPEVSLKLTWVNGGAEITCDSAHFESVVAAAERLLGKASGFVHAAPVAPEVSPAEREAPAPADRVATAPKPRKSPSRSPNGGERSKLGSGAYKDFEDFKWDIDDQAELRIATFYKEKAPKTQNEKVAVLLSALRDLGGKARVTYREIYKAYRLCDRGEPMKSLSGVISNMAAENLVSREDDGIRLKAFGDELVTKELPRGESKSA